MSEEKIKDMILKQCLELTTNNDLRPPISAYNGVDIDDVVRACKQLQDKKTYIDLVKENQSLKKENKILRENAEHNDKVVDKINWENQLLKKQLEEYKHKGLYNTCLPYSTGYKKAIKEKENQQKEFIDYLEKEKDRLARECSHTYEDSLGKTKFVNEDIFNEVDKNLSKYKEITGQVDSQVDSQV